MIKIIAMFVIVVVVLVAALLAFAATRADTFRVERSTSVKAPPEQIFVQINDFHNWGLWSPYDKLDPAMTKTISGSASGKGAVYEWDGNSNVGKGRMEITETTEPSRVTVKLDFIKPFEGHNIAEFTMVPNGDSTKVTWAMHGPTAFPVKVMGIFLNMDNMIGKEFEAGLANLKSLAEK
jgi:carbon monoxide dehydrogenase subunit G